MKVIGFSRIFIYSDQTARIGLQVKLDKEMMEKLKLVDPSIYVKVSKKDCMFDTDNMDLEIYDQGQPTHYHLHTDEIPKVFNYISRKRKFLINTLNEKAS